MKEIPRGILIDVDRTLTREDRSISGRTRRALRQVAEAGIKLGLCTGRQWAFLQTVVELFSAESLHVIAGGGLLVNARGEILSGCQMNSEIIDRLWTLTAETGVGLITGVGEKAYATRVEDQKLFAVDKWVREVNAWEVCEQCRASPLMIVRPLTTAGEAWLGRWQEEGLLTYKVMQSYGGERYADVTAWGVTKGRMAGSWAKKQGLTLAEVAAVGDGLNDIEVIEKVGLGVAMGNGATELKQVADLVIGETGADGLAKWLESLV